MQKKLWLPILMILLGINIPIIDAASSNDSSTTTMNETQQSKSKKTANTNKKNKKLYTRKDQVKLTERNFHTLSSQDQATHLKIKALRKVITVDPAQEDIKSYRQKVNQLLDSSEQKIPIIKKDKFFKNLSNEDQAIILEIEALEREKTLEPGKEPIKSYQQEINQLVDSFGNRVPHIWINNLTETSPATRYFAANT